MSCHWELLGVGGDSGGFADGVGGSFALHGGLRPPWEGFALHIPAGYGRQETEDRSQKVTLTLEWSRSRERVE